ncbi:MAG: phosphoribosylformylglycinamidine synthase subunit PurL, partial [Acidimicrobiales bacterium]|nr:phosphoribosylformylglycinamidine synthase subunit PurL [Acidimicrobiales bacterium]
MTSHGLAEPIHRQLGLSDDEESAIRGELGRPPNHLELAMYSVMWSEHCSYKSSRLHLRRLPTTGPTVLAGVGENAGVVAVGGGLAVAVRIESHNHPSAIEPHQGAATGVGGILRDVFAVGARPIALMDSLRFGSLDDPRNRWLVDGVVSGIAGYGNSVGVPTVGGEVVFDDRYRANPLVNVLALGILPVERLTLSSASGPGNAVVLIGGRTGRDGIGGVSLLASTGLDEGSGA